MEEQKKTMEKLLAAADDAQARGDLETAKELLTRCQKLAPFRSDIRERLENLLEKLSDNIPAAPKRKEPQEHTVAEHRVEEGVATPRPQEERSEISRIVQPREQDLWTFAPVADYQGNDDKQSIVTKTDAAANDADVCMGLSADEFFADRKTTRQTSIGPKPPGSDQPVAPSDKKRSLAGSSPHLAKKSVATQSRPTTARHFSDPVTRDWRHDWQRWLPHVSPHVQAVFAVYGTIALFLIASSAVSYRKFFFHKSAYPEGMVAGQTATPAPTPVAGRGPAPAPNGESLQILRLAKDYIRQQRYEEAATLLSNQIDRISDSGLRATYAEELARTYDLLGTSLLEKNKLLQAVSAYDKAVRLAPSSATFRLHLANAHYYCGILLKTEDARCHLELADQEVSKVLAQDPRNLDAYQLQASVREKIENIQGALAALTKILELAPPSSQEAIAAREKKNRLSQAR
ncbi:MAG: hypothetical protein ACP5UB_03120 [Candidatus Sumerlaeaceae bacterium]|jgi:tetratricopeptide (TPR) repeat protein